jgi:hypothetical protein
MTILSTEGAGGTSYPTGEAGIGDSDPEFHVVVLDDELSRAPTSVTVVVDGGRPQVEARFSIDGTLVYTDDLDINGSLEPTSLPVTETVGGALGSHTVSVEQDVIGSTSDTYTMAKDPQAQPSIQGPDTDPVAVPGAVDALGVRHWVAQDLLAEVDGGIGSYIFPRNPREMSSPHLQFALKTHHTTARSEGMFHIFQAGAIPVEWTFSGLATTEEEVAALEAYRDLNRRFYTIDHRNRAWKTVWTNVDIVPRLRSVYNGEVTDWLTDYTVTAIIVDQNYRTPA